MNREINREEFMGFVVINELYDFMEKPRGYLDLIDTFDCEVIIINSDSDYQGDSRLLLKNQEKYGILIYGWGSCSGCDAFLSCQNDIDDLLELRNQLWRQIDWKDKSEIIEYINNHDWEGDYSWHNEETRNFVCELKNFFGIV